MDSWAGVGLEGLRRKGKREVAAGVLLERNEY